MRSLVKKEAHATEQAGARGSALARRRPPGHFGAQQRSAALGGDVHRWSVMPLSDNRHPCSLDLEDV